MAPIDNAEIRALFSEDNSSLFSRQFFTENYERIVQILDGKTPPPKEVEIQPSSICNAGCKHCFGKNYCRTKNNMLDREDMESVVEQVLDMSWDGLTVEKVKFCGSTGEPLLNPQTLYGIELLSKHKPVELFTNGILLAEHSRDADYLAVLSQLSQLNVSLDAGSTRTLHAIKPGSKNVLLEDIILGVNAIKELGDVHTIFSFVITQENYFEIEEFAQKASVAANVLNYRIDMTDRGVSELYKGSILYSLERAKLYESDSCIVQISHSEHQIASSSSESFSSRDLGLPCSLSSFWTCIGPNAELYPCGHVVAADTPSCGSVFEQSMSGIWHGDVRREYNNLLPMAKCDVCSPFSLKLNKLMSEISVLGKEGFVELYAELIQNAS